MIASRLSFALALALAACMSVGCSDDDDETPSTPADTGVVGDTGTTTDTSTPADTGGTTDTGTESDTSTGDTGGDTGGGDTATTTHTINVGPGASNTFAPANMTIKVGDTVEWVWQGDLHSVTEASDTGCTPKSGGFDSGIQSTGFKFTRTFSTAGTINYFCTPHCTLGMKGTITVTP